MSGKGPGAPVLLFLGEPSIVDPLVQKAADEVLGKAAQSLDFEVLRFGDRTLVEVESALRQVGMFASERCIWLRGFLESKRKARGEDDEEAEDEDEGGGGGGDDLLALLERGVPPGTTFLVSAASLDARGRLFKWFSKFGQVRDHRVATGRDGKLSPEGLRVAIEARLREGGVRKPGPGVVDEILRRSGAVVGEMLQEVDRLLLSLDDPSTLSVEQVKASMRDLGHAWVFGLTDAIGARDLAQAEGLVERLLAEGEVPLRLVALLGSHVAGLVEARDVVGTLPRGALQARGGDFLRDHGASLPEPFRRRYPAWRGYFLLRSAANFSPSELRGLHGELVALDLALKSSRTSPLLLLSRLLQGACMARARG